jgi:predicted transcriptional regulator of viral defense system
MERYNLATATKKIYNSGFSLFTLQTLKNILGIKKESTLFKVISRLLESGIILRIERNKYLLKESDVSSFALANFIYQPSYVSFESALNFYGILSQFPYSISSATTRKTNKKVVQGKEFAYTHIKKDLFWGYEKKNDFIIAFPEKALLDQLYLVSKGYRKTSIDEYDLSRLNISRLKKYLKKYPKDRQYKKITEILKNYLSL